MGFSADEHAIAAEQRTASQLIATLEGGQLNEDLSDAIKDIVATLHDALSSRGGKPKGGLTLKLDIKLDGGVVELTSDISVRKPKVERMKTVMWATPQNNLTPRNPNQGTLELRTVADAGMRTIRDDAPIVRGA